MTSHLRNLRSKVQSQHDNMENSPETITSEKIEQDHTVLPTSHEPSLNAPPSEGSVPPAATRPYPSGWRLYIIVVALLLVTLLVAIDNTVIGVVIPKITTVFKALTDVGWYGSAYLLTVTGFQPIFGNFYRLFQVKIVYLISVLIFEAGSIVCASAPSSPAFIVGRAIAGVGAAGIFQGALGVIGFIAPLEKRSMYFGIVISVFGFATCFGPIMGGAFTDHASWRWCFWINLPIGAVACLLVLIFLNLQNTDSPSRKLPLKTKLQQMDVGGAAILIAAVCCLLLALQWGGTASPWNSSRIIGLFVGFGLLSLTFGILQWKLGEIATTPLRILRQRSIYMGSSFVAFTNIAIFTLAYFMPFYFQAVQGVSATTSGIRFTLLALPEIVAIVVSGAIVSKTGHYVPFMILGVIIGSVGAGLLSRISVGTSTLQWAAFLVVAGIGIATGRQQPYTAIQLVLKEDDILIGNAIMVFFTQLGGAVSISLAQTILLNGLLREVPKVTGVVSAESVVNTGATNLTSLTNDPHTLLAIRVAYSTAIRDVILFTAGTIAVALPFALGMEWRNVKKVESSGIEPTSTTTAIAQ